MSYAKTRLMRDLRIYNKRSSQTSSEAKDSGETDEKLLDDVSDMALLLMMLLW